MTMPKWFRTMFHSRAFDKEEGDNKQRFHQDEIDAIMNRVPDHRIWGIYRCRRCGSEYNFDGWTCMIGGPIGEDIKTVADARWYLNENRQELHECADGVQGLGICIGYRKKEPDIFSDIKDAVDTATQEIIKDIKL